MSLLLKLLTTICTLFLLSGVVAGAQCDSAWQDIPDSALRAVEMGREGEEPSESVPSSASLTPYFSFQHHHDSTLFRVKVGEFKRNGEKLKLSNWCIERVINEPSKKKLQLVVWPPDELRNRSTTRVFSVRAADTLTSFRTYWWVDGTDADMEAPRSSRHINTHHVSYSVELLDAASDERIMLMDTLYIGAMAGSERPCIYSWYPPLSRIRSIVPSKVNGIVRAYIRVNIYDNEPTNATPIMRLDDGEAFPMSSRVLRDAMTLTYNDSADVETPCSLSDMRAIKIAASTSGISLKLEANSPIDHVRIYDLYGAEVWSKDTPSSSLSMSAPTDKGHFIVVGESHGAIVCSQSVFVR